MTTVPADPKFQMPHEAGAVGLQHDAESRLRELVLEGLNCGPSQKTSIAELTGELLHRIRASVVLKKAT